MKKEFGKNRIMRYKFRDIESFRQPLNKHGNCLIFEVLTAMEDVDVGLFSCDAVWACR
jgi:hypothetical protein